VAAALAVFLPAIASAAVPSSSFTATTIPVNGALSLVALTRPIDNHTSLVAGGSGGVSLLANNGSGSFSTSASYPAAAAPSLPGIGVGDINNDGFRDIVTIGSILFGQAGGAYSQQNFGPPASTGAVDVGDINGDGIADIAFAQYGGNSVTVWIGRPGAPGAWSPAAVETDAAGGNPFSVAVGDLNGDGRADVVVANGSSNTVTVYNGAASPPYLVGRHDYTTAPGGSPEPDNLALADVNGDQARHPRRRPRAWPDLDLPQHRGGSLRRPDHLLGRSAGHVGAHRQLVGCARGCSRRLQQRRQAGRRRPDPVGSGRRSLQPGRRPLRQRQRQLRL
jgi:hypothetical protein